MWKRWAMTCWWHAINLLTIIFTEINAHRADLNHYTNSTQSQNLYAMFPSLVIIKGAPSVARNLAIWSTWDPEWEAEIDCQMAYASHDQSRELYLLRPLFWGKKGKLDWERPLLEHFFYLGSRVAAFFHRSDCSVEMSRSLLKFSCTSDLAQQQTVRWNH